MPDDDGVDEELQAAMRLGATAVSALREQRARGREVEARQAEDRARADAELGRRRGEALGAAAAVRPAVRAVDRERGDPGVLPEEVAGQRRQRDEAAAVVAADQRREAREVPSTREQGWLSPEDARERPQEWLQQRVDSGDLSPGVERRARELLLDGSQRASVFGADAGPGLDGVERAYRLDQELTAELGPGWPGRADLPAEALARVEAHAEDLRAAGYTPAALAGREDLDRVPVVPQQERAAARVRVLHYDPEARRQELAGVADPDAVEAAVLAGAAQGRPAEEAVTSGPGRAPKARRWLGRGGKQQERGPRGR